MITGVAAFDATYQEQKNLLGTKGPAIKLFNGPLK